MALRETNTTRLTDRQQEVLDWIKSHIRRDGVPQTRTEIAHGLGLSEASPVVGHLKALARNGRIEMLPTRTGVSASAAKTTPSWGPCRRSLPARRWSATPASSSGCLESSGCLPDFLLTVRGDSMEKAGIRDDDLIAVHRTPEPRSGQIVVARFRDEVTVKQFVKIDDRDIELRKPEYSPQGHGTRPCGTHPAVRRRGRGSPDQGSRRHDLGHGAQEPAKVDITKAETRTRPTPTPRSRPQPPVSDRQGGQVHPASANPKPRRRQTTPSRPEERSTATTSCGCRHPPRRPPEPSGSRGGRRHRQRRQPQLHLWEQNPKRHCCELGLQPPDRLPQTPTTVQRRGPGRRHQLKPSAPAPPTPTALQRGQPASPAA